MTAADLAELNGLLGREAERRVQRGDHRGKEAIIDDILLRAEAPPIGAVLSRVAAMVARPLARVLP